MGLPFIGRMVDVVYDPADITELTIEYEGYTPWRVKGLVIGDRAGKRPPLPEHMSPEKTDTSRLLNAAAECNQIPKEAQAPAVSYRKAVKEEPHV